jgi:hypothetical protein
MQSKPFSVGVRIEHLRKVIDIAQYGIDTTETPDLMAANYKLACDTKTGRRLYTFCMCPGGTVVPSQTAEGTICTNGMSVRLRDGDNSNSAILVPVDSNDYGEGTLDGMYYQENLEKLAFKAGGSNGFAPAARYGDLIEGKATEEFGKVKPSYRPGVKPADLKEVFRHNGVILHHFNTQPAGDLLTVSATGAYDVYFPAVEREGFGGTERRIVAFVHRMNTAELRDNEVLNAAQIYLTQTPVETPRSIVRPTTLFDLGGRPVAPRNLRSGIYLQGGRKVVR